MVLKISDIQNCSWLISEMEVIKISAVSWLVSIKRHGPPHGYSYPHEITPWCYIKRDSTIEKQSPFLGCHQWLKVSPIYHYGWDPWIKKKVDYLSCIEERSERHLMYFIIWCGNCFSIIKSLLLYAYIIYALWTYSHSVTVWYRIRKEIL